MRALIARLLRLIFDGRRDRAADVETFPLIWCEPENRGWCGVAGCCLYSCWNFEPEDER